MKKLFSCLMAFLLTFTMASCFEPIDDTSGSGEDSTSEIVTPEPVTLAGKNIVFLGSSLTYGDQRIRRYCLEGHIRKPVYRKGNRHFT